MKKLLLLIISAGCVSLIPAGLSLAQQARSTLGIRHLHVAISREVTVGVVTEADTIQFFSSREVTVHVQSDETIHLAISREVSVSVP